MESGNSPYEREQTTETPPMHRRALLSCLCSLWVNVCVCLCAPYAIESKCFPVTVFVRGLVAAMASGGTTDAISSFIYFFSVFPFVVMQTMVVHTLHRFNGYDFFILGKLYDYVFCSLCLFLFLFFLFGFLRRCVWDIHNIIK